jgi:hypothetical protein
MISRCRERSHGVLKDLLALSYHIIRHGYVTSLGGHLIHLIQIELDKGLRLRSSQ